MNNQARDSRTEMVRQDGHKFLEQTTMTGAKPGSSVDLYRAKVAALFGRTIEPSESPPLLMTTPAAEAAPALLPEALREIREHLAQQVRENRAQRRAASRERLRELLDAPSDQPAPDYTPSSLQEARQRVNVRVRVRPPPRAHSGPAWGELSAAAVLEAAPSVSVGARRLFELLFSVAVATGEERGYRVTPTTVAYHLPQLLVAGVLGYTARHVRRLSGELERAGLIDAGAHASNVTTREGKRRRMWDGSLWCVKIVPSNSDAYLTPEQWQHEWRAFDADLKAGRTAQKVMSYLKTCEEMEDRLHVLSLWAVNPNASFSPLSLERTFEARRRESVQDVVYALPLLAELSGHQLAEAIGRAASEIAHHLNDQHSRRQWCALLWAATRNHTLEGFTAQLLRLLTDVQEWPELRNPGALFTSRHRAV